MASGGAGTSPRQLGYPLQGARLLEKVGGAGNYRELAVSRYLCLCLAIEVDHHVIPAADEQQGG